MADSRSLFQKSKDKFNLQRMTAAGQPSWIVGQIPTQQGQELPELQGRNDIGTVAYVPNAGTAISVTRPALYDKATAAHEATHVFQNTRNDQFQNLMQLMMPKTDSVSNYDYGGVNGLIANPQKSVAAYSPEQQAQMVEDLTAAQGKLTPNMTPAQLAAWDKTKTALERPIQQLASVPAQNNSVAGKVDHYLNQRGFGSPLEQLMGVLSPPTMSAAPQPAPAAPSVALGYANRSKLVR